MISDTLISQTQPVRPEGVETLKNQTVKALISMAKSAVDADRTVQRFNRELRGSDTIELLSAKYDYVLGLFQMKRDSRDAYTPEGSSKFDIIATDYYSLLSYLIH